MIFIRQQKYLFEIANSSVDFVINEAKSQKVETLFIEF